MAKSLDELIEYLLAEIAVCGPGGVTVSQITEFTKAFYNGDASSCTTQDVEAARSGPESVGQTVDHTLIAKIWKWLGKHRDVSIGQNHEYDHTPLEHFRARPLDQATAQWSKSVPKLFISEELTYRAICGHAPDRTRIFPSEYALLSHIAGARADGILQGQLGRVAGQDKRSVPKRTDDLHAKGYIVKRSVYVKGTKTSLLLLRRYDRSASNHDNNADVATSSTPAGPPDNPRVLVRDVVNKLAEAVSDGTLIEIEKLLDVLDDKSPAASKILTKLIRALEKAGCLKRVRAAFGPAAQSGDLKTFVQQVRGPSAEDLLGLVKASISPDRPIEDWLSEEKAKTFSPQQGPLSPVVPQSSQPLVQWNPDRLVANTLQHAVSQSGSGGLTNIRARTVISGMFIRRTLESVLVRLSHRALLSQPESLRHLAIIRTTRSTGGAIEYIHHDLDSFIKSVESGSIDSSSVAGAKHFLEESSRRSARDVDDYQYHPLDLLDRGEPKSLAYLIQSVKAIDVPARHGEPKIALNQDGVEAVMRISKDETAEDSEKESGGEERAVEIIVPAPQKSRKRMKRKTIHSVSTDPPQVQPHKRSRKKVINSDSDDPSHSQPQKRTRRKTIHDDFDDRPKGRPRKFVRGTEKFWQHHFWQAKLAAAGEEGIQAAKEGTMNDPAGLELFENRPNNFDETLLEAKAAGLPLPAVPDDITDHWVRQTRQVLERADKGAYITPGGMYLGRVKYRTQLMIVRSDRLNSVDWYDRKEVPSFRHMSSSYAHSLPCRRYYPEMAKPLRRPTRTPKKPKSQAQEGVTNTDQTTEKATHGLGPQMGVFLEAGLADMDTTLFSKAQAQSVPDPATPDVSRYMDTTDSDSGPESAQRLPESEARPTSAQSHDMVAIHTGRSASGIEKPVPLQGRKDGLKRKPSRTPEQDSTQHVNGEQESSSPTTIHLPTHAPHASAVRELEGCPEGRNTNLPVVSSKQANGYNLTLDTSGLSGSVPSANALEMPPSSHSRASASLLNHAVPTDVADADGGILAGENSARKVPTAKIVPESPVAVPTYQSTHNKDMVETALPAPTSDGVQPASGVSQQTQVRSETATPTTRKRSLSATDSDAFEPRSPTKRQRRGRGGAVQICQKIILELVILAQGAAPNDRSTLRRCMANRWQAAGGKDRPLMTPIKAAVRNLVESGSVKEHIFTFRGKGGIMLKRSILHLPRIEATSSQIYELKQKLITADTTEHIPAEWVAETLPTLNNAGSRRRTIIPTDRPPIQPLPTPEDSPQLLGTDAHVVDAIETESPKATRPRRTNKRGIVMEESRSSTPEAIASPELQTSPSNGFLSLKVPGLANLRQVREFNSTLQEPSWKALLPPVPLKFSTAASFDNATALPTPAHQRKSGLRRQKKQTRYDEGTRKIIWAPPEQTIPESLEHLLRLEAIRGNKVDDGNANETTETVFQEIDLVAGWEERDADFILSKNASWRFINHKSSIDFPKVATQSWSLVEYDDIGQAIEREWTEYPSWEPFVAAAQQKSARKKRLIRRHKEPQESSPLPTQTSGRTSDRRVTRQATGTVKKRRWTSFAEDVEYSPRSKRTKRASAVIDGDFVGPSIEEPDEEGPTTLTRSQPKPVQIFAKRTHLLEDDECLPFAIAVTCVRTLAGGIEKVVDWALIQKLFPEQLMTELQSRWRTVVQKYRHDLHQLTESFQDHYIEALEKEEAPSTDFNEPEGSDLSAIVAWATSNLGTASSEVQERLAGSKDQMFADKRIQVEEIRGLKEIYGYNVVTSNPAKDEIYSTVVSGARARALPRSGQDSVQEVDKTELELADPVFARARSLVLAVIRTSESQFEAGIATQKLTGLTDTKDDSENYVKRAVEALQRDQLIVKQPNSGTDRTDLRAWQLSDSFEEALVSRRMVHRLMLRKAATYKLSILDAAFSRGERVTIAKDAFMDDGEMVAILNLASQGQIQIRHGADVPNSRYGVDWENVGYQTKLIDKSKVAFSTILQPTDSYTYGNHLANTRAKLVPRGGVDEPRGLIPLWFDIHGTLQNEWWEVVLAAVLGLLSIRPGVDSRELAHMLSWTLIPDEVDLILNYSRASGLAKQTLSGKGWETKEWWWMALGDDITWS